MVSSGANPWPHSDYIILDFLYFTMPCLCCAIVSIILLAVFLAKRARRSFVFLATATTTASVSLTLVFPADFGLYSVPIAACVMAVFNTTLCTLVYFLLVNRKRRPKTYPPDAEDTSPPPPPVGARAHLPEIVLGSIAMTSTLLGLLLVFLLDGICIGTQPVTFTTKYSRDAMPALCRLDVECFLYATVDRTSSSLLVTSHMANGGRLGPYGDVRASFAVTDTLRNVTTEVPATVVLKRINVNEQERLLVYGNLTSLAPDTLYSVQAIYRGGGTVIRGTATLVRSLPHDLMGEGSPISFLVGGDVYFGDRGWNVLRAAIRSSPNATFAIIGGDIAYDNNLPTCYRRWDEFFLQWQAIMVRGDGAVVPLLTTIGNHEGGGYLKDTDVHFYVDYFRYGSEDPQVPTVHAHTIAGLIGVLALDSGVAASVESQRGLIDATLQRWGHEGRVTFAAYHVPAYPSYRSFTDAISSSVREHWSPLFERRNLTLALEHHDHKYKRSYPIAGGAVVPPGLGGGRGITYVGDGSIGVWDKKRVGGDVLPWYLARREERDFMLHVSVHRNRTVRCIAIDVNGNAFDDFTPTPPGPPRDPTTASVKRRAQCHYVKAHSLHVALNNALEQCALLQPEDPAEFLAEYFLRLAVEVRREEGYAASVSTLGHRRRVDVDMLIATPTAPFK